MSLIKSVFVTIIAFVVLGLGISLIINYNLEKQSDEILAKAKDLYEHRNYNKALSLIEKYPSYSNKEDFLFIKFKSLM